MIFSAAQLATSLYYLFFVLSKDTIRSDWLQEARFGGDYNTYSYAAARSSALSTRDIGYLLKDAFTFLAVVIAILAVIEFILFMIKCTSCDSKNSKKEVN